MHLHSPGYPHNLLKTTSFINLQGVSFGMMEKFSIVGAILILGIAFILPSVLGTEFGSEINDFLWELQQNPSEYTLVFDLGISPVEEQSMIAFSEQYKISRSRLDTDIGVKESNLIVIGSPARNSIIKRLGFFEDSSVTVNLAAGKKLVIASSDPQELSRLLQELAEFEVTKPASSAKEAATQSGAEQKPIPASESQPGFFGKIFDQLSPGKSTLWVLLLVVISPIFGVAIVRQVHRIKKVKENKERVKNYLATYLQRGYHPMYLRSYLLQQRWDPKIVDEAFSRLRK